jgi:hypothetical protein
MTKDRELTTTTKVTDWFAGRLPAQWSSGPAQIDVDREEIIVVIPQPDSPGSEDFRETTRDQRIALARAAQEAFARRVSWGIVRQGVLRLFTTVRAPVTAELAMPERRVLDLLTESGVAANRSEAVAWCVRLVGQHEADWLRDLHDAAASAGSRPEQPTEF